VTLHGLEQAQRDVQERTDRALRELDSLSVQDPFLRDLFLKLVSREK
jgi:hypothetical protein